jgi:hypothetical protein
MANETRISRITVSRIIDAPAREIFDVLTLPARHREIDGSGFVVSDDRTDRITGVGQVSGWEWMWELQADGSDATEVTLTYDWDKVTDRALLQKVSFPLVSQDQLEESLANLAAAVAS